MPIILRFQNLCGANFIANCLALSPKVLHCDYNWAMKKYRGNLSVEQNFAVSLWPAVETLRTQSHVEYHSKKILDSDLMHQTDFYTVHRDSEQQDSFPEIEKLVIRAINTEKIFAMRESDEKTYQEISSKIVLPIITNAQSHDIDMNTIDSSIDFYKQIQHTCEFLKIDQIHYNMIETLRMVWLKSVPVIKKDAETKFNLDRFYAATKLKDNA